jgi:hypothetical protein
MEKLTSISLPNLNFSLKKMGDFLFHEGPIQSHFINDKDENFIGFWADGNEKLNRWLFVKVEEKLLHAFFEKQENTVALIEKNADGFAYAIDINGKGEWQNFQLISNEDIPKSYFPSADSYYLEEHYEPYAEELRNYLAHLFERKRKIYEVKEVEVGSVREADDLNVNR